MRAHLPWSPSRRRHPVRDQPPSSPVQLRHHPPEPSPPHLVHLSPEHQLQDPEITFGTESERKIEVDREEERVSPTEELAETLGVKPVRRHYITGDGRVIMVSHVSYPMDRYDAFVFRMKLTRES